MNILTEPTLTDPPTTLSKGNDAGDHTFWNLLKEAMQSMVSLLSLLINTFQIP